MRFRPGVKFFAVFFIFLLALIFNWRPFSADKKIKPDDKISVKGISAKIEHLESCWEGCHQYDEIKLVANYQTLGEEFFKKEIGLPWQPYTHGIIAFPKKETLLTIFSSNNQGSVVSGITHVDGKPHLLPLMGCIEGDNPTFSYQAPAHGYHCASSNRQLSWGYPAIFFHSLQISYHYDFWIDYATQNFHEIATNVPENSKFVGVIDLEKERSYLLVLFRAEDKNNSTLCAYGNSGTQATYQCTEFSASVPLSLLESLKKAHAPKIPVATSGIEYVEYDNASLKKWISQYFTLSPEGSPFPIPTANTAIVNFQKGVKPPPLEEWQSICAQCQQT